MEVQSFADIEQDFLERVFQVVWCNVATVDTHNRPRSRILHPIWEGVTGWIATDPRSLKAKHLAQNPHVSLAYVHDMSKPVYADCTAQWIDDIAEKQRIWELYKHAPPPMGYDPEPFFNSYTDTRFGVLRLTPWRIEVADFPGNTRVWHAAE